MMKLASNCGTDVVRKCQKSNPAARQVQSEGYGLLGSYREGTGAVTSIHSIGYSLNYLLVKFIQQ